MDTSSSSSAPRGLVGNRLALAGAVLYLLEWVAIIGASPPGPLGPGTSVGRLTADFAEHAGNAAFAASWFAVVLVGRVLFVAGLKAALRHRPRELPLLDLALSAMAVSVALEVMGYGLVAAGARLAADGGPADAVVALDAGGYWLTLLIFGPVAVSVLASAVAMLRSRLFANWLCWVGIVSGTVGVGTALLAATAGEEGGSGPFDAASAGCVLLMWVWMIGTGVVLLRPDVGAEVPVSERG